MAVAAAAAAAAATTATASATATATATATVVIAYVVPKSLETKHPYKRIDPSAIISALFHLSSDGS